MPASSWNRFISLHLDLFTIRGLSHRDSHILRHFKPAVAVLQEQNTLHTEVCLQPFMWILPPAFHHLACADNILVPAALGMRILTAGSSIMLKLCTFPALFTVVVAVIVTLLGIGNFAEGISPSEQSSNYICL